MLIQFRVANFRSFNEEQTLSLVASKDTKHPGNLIQGDKFNLLKAAAVYGANASGKSNLIRAFGDMSWFIRVSATSMNQGDRIPVGNPFRLAPASAARPSVFEATFIANDIRYEYGFAATAQRVHEEWLNAYPKGRRQRWFEREFDPETNKTSWVFREPLKKDQEILREKTRDNGLVLSRGAELNVGPLSDVFLWFREGMWVLDVSVPPFGLMQGTAKRVTDDAGFHQRVGRMMKHADFGIDGLSVAERPVFPKDLPQDAPEDFKRFVAALTELAHSEEEPALTQFSVQTTHHIPGSDAAQQFDMLRDESNGTQRFFALAGPVLDALDKGSVMVVDELECSMHPLLTRKLLELFQSPAANKNGAQLIFATHNSTLMDSELFRRDQIWLVEKNRSGASELCSLYDFDTQDRPRTTEALERNYLAGRYGGVPKFGSIFEDLELK